jgi:K(+)-stimulated pyrophosphate-energized sodium pump
VGLGLFGFGILYLFFSNILLINEEMNLVLIILSGFSIGASSIALFARVAGGIYTKAADIGADIVGKIEKNIPEDDPRNPGVIADNVGDNVGDVAGMGADLFESYMGAIISSMIIGSTILVNESLIMNDFKDSEIFVHFPLSIASIGVLSSIIGIFFIKSEKKRSIQNSLNVGMYIASILIIIMSYILINFFIPNYFSFSIDLKIFNKWGLFVSIIIGLFAGLLIGFITEYFCSKENKPVMEIVNSLKTGSATAVISGLSIGMRSTFFPIMLISISIMISNHFAGLYGIAISALSMLSLVGIQLAIDAYGPIADNAGGIAEMSNLGAETRERTDSLDSVGNTTAAIGKGFAISSAAFTSFALFSAYITQISIITKKNPSEIIISINKPHVMAGLFIGSMLPFLFSSMAIKSVGKAAFEIINEIRRQFKTMNGLLSGSESPDYNKCIDIATKASLREMFLPGSLAILAPVVAGFIDGSGLLLGGLLAGSISSGVVLATFMSNSGSAWDNAKKKIEEIKKKNTKEHSASIVGDTIGDPLKDTAAPSLNILIKLISIISLIISPIITKYGMNIFD